MSGGGVDMVRIPTVRVEDGQGGYMVINAADFDGDRYRIYEDSPPYPASAPADGGDSPDAGDGDGGDSTQPLPPDFAIATRANYLKEHNTVTALRQMAKAWEVPGRSSMNEDALALAIAQAESTANTVEAYAAAGRAAEGG